MLRKLKIKTHVQKFAADTVTPVAAYLKLRDRFPGSLLLESADYRGSENSFSFICCVPLAQMSLSAGRLSLKYGISEMSDDGRQPKQRLAQTVRDFFGSVSVVAQSGENPTINGFFGFTAYDAVPYFEDIHFGSSKEKARDIPELCYGFFKYILAFNHFKNELHILKNSPADDDDDGSDLKVLYDIICGAAPRPMPFACDGDETSNLDDARHLEIIAKCKEHIVRGDVFQIVTSRRFTAGYKGDDFQVYRALRSVNPSPYLFYFDYGDFRIFGSSPEAQIQIKDGKASIFPIAGTYARSADRSDDAELAQALSHDPKENAEHVMLVDLARNDLSKHCDQVQVETYKEVQFYSHVIHLVSKVSGRLHKDVSVVDILADTFPAGTLTGAPKYRAMELIDRYENSGRACYGGAIGFIGLNRDCNHAIIIRSFLSKDNKLHFQAGAGIVFDSDPKSEVNEVKNKLGALRRAIQLAAEGI